MITLKLAPALSLPVDAVTQRHGFLGKPGSGKSYAATKLAELMYDIGAQFVALDPVGIWYGLRIDGKGKGLPIPVFGGLHGDVPLEPDKGGAVADLIVDRRLSCVLDVSQFEHDTEKTKFATAFAARFFFRMKAAPAPVHIFLEECQEFIPQNPQRGEEQMVHAFTRMDKLGRNFGIGMSLVSQRPQEVSKKVLNLTECLFAFQMTGAHERKAIKEWVTTVGADENILTVLPGLAVAHAHVYSPQWLRISETVKIGEKRTADVSSTPAVGVSPVAGKPLARVDLELIREQMAASIEKAKSEDPKELRAEIAKLRRELNGQAKTSVAVMTMRDADEKALKQSIDSAVRIVVKTERERYDRLETAAKHLLKYAKGIANEVDACRSSVGLMVSTYEEALQRNEVTPLPDTSTLLRISAATVTAKSGDRVHGLKDESSNGNLKGVKIKVLRGLAELEAIGVRAVSRAQLSFYVGVSFAGGYGANAVSAMRTAGLIEYPSDGHLCLSDPGRVLVGRCEPPDSLSDLHSRIAEHLSGLELRIFDAMVALRRAGRIDRETLGQQLDVSFAGGYGANSISALRTAGIIDYPEKGWVGPSDLLFPEGLR